MAPPYEAVIVVSFGGPDGPEDVVPFLEHVTRGRGIPRQRLSEIAEHYQLFGGVSPINGHNRRLVDALDRVLGEHGPALPVYWGNRNWHPFLVDALAQMADEGVRRALAFVTSPFSSYSGCRQYLDDIAAARLQLGGRAPEVDKLRLFYNHPGFIEPVARGALQALEALPSDRRNVAALVFTAHSLPLPMAATSDYQAQLAEAARLVTERVGGQRPWRVVFQSRSGPPSQPWLEPDVSDHLEELARTGIAAATVVPLGFVSDHMEVVYDLDVVACQRGTAAGLSVARAPTPGADPQFVAMIRELILERTSPSTSVERRALGTMGPWPDTCPEGHCPAPTRPGWPAS